MNLAPILAAAAVASAPTPGATAPAPVEGRVMLKCTLHDDGTVSPCEVESETPPGMGFGERALELAKHSRFNRDRGPGIVRVPMVFPVIDLSADTSPPANSPTP